MWVLIPRGQPLSLRYARWARTYIERTSGSKVENRWDHFAFGAATLNKSLMLEVSGATLSNLIDELPLLRFITASIGCEMMLRDAKELRVKESDALPLLWKISRAWGRA